MADKEENSSLSGEETKKTEDAPDLSVAEEVAPSLETASLDTNLLGDGAPQTVAKDKTKIDILLKPTGNAPIMKKRRWAVNQDQHIGWISEFIKKYLKLDASERLFLYINQTFAPAPDQTVKNLYDCYGTDGKLIIHYCKSQAWG